MRERTRETLAKVVKETLTSIVEEGRGYEKRSGTHP
jgi:hypothetical protein